MYHSSAAYFEINTYGVQEKVQEFRRRCWIAEEGAGVQKKVLESRIRCLCPKH